MFFNAYIFKRQVHVFAGPVTENWKSLVLQDKCNIEIFLSPLGDCNSRMGLRFVNKKLSLGNK